MNPTSPDQPNDHARRTPDEVIRLARNVLGEIDLDPASDRWANQRVQAKHYYTELDDGLVQPWRGRVFLNPPGGHVKIEGMKARQSKSALWWHRLDQEYWQGRIDAAIFVAYNLEAFLNTQRWPGRPCQAYPFCVPDKRLVFPSSGGSNSDSPPGASAIVYLGPDCVKFKEEFQQMGYVRT